MTIKNPITVLADVSGSQVGTSTNPLFISGTLQFPGISIANYITLGSDSNAAYVLTGSATSSLPNGQPHETLRQLVHLANDDGPRGSQWANNLVQDSDSSPFPTGSIWYIDSSRTQKVVQKIITRNASQLPVTIQWKAYAPDGVTVVESYTDTISYVGIFETSRTRSQP